MTKTFIILLLTIMAILLIASSWNDAPTVDEPTHIFAGVTYVKLRDLRQNPEHPPFIKLLSGLSLKLFYPNLTFPFTFEELAPALSFSITDYGTKMFILNDPTKYLLLARLPVIAITLLGGAIVYLLSTKLGGRKAGVFSLLLYVFEPNILTHGRLVTTDAALMVFTLATIYCLTQLWEMFICHSERSRGIFLTLPLLKEIPPRELVPSVVEGVGMTMTWFILSFLSTTILLLTKYSALAVLPVVFISYVLAAWFSATGNKRQIVLSIVLMALLSWGFIWGFYAFFRPNDFPYQDSAKIQNLMALVQPRWLVNGLLTQPFLPAYFRHGVRIVAAHAFYGQQFFLAGDFGNFNKLYLYPKIFLLKTPIPLLVFFLVGLLIYKMQWNKEVMKQSKFLTLFLVLTALGYTLILLTSNIFFGIRNVLPLTSILIILTAPTIGWWLKRAKRVKIFFLIILVYVAENFLTFPSYLAYGNQLLGSRANKRAALADSNIDWGQDLKRLSLWLEEKNIARLPFHYFGTASPAAYGITADHLPTREENDRPIGYVALSVSNKNYAYRIEENGKVRFLFNAYNYLDGLQPVKIIGDSIMVYYLE